MPPSLKRRQSAATLDLDSSQNPLPTDLQGQRLCEIFGHYPWCWIYADAPEPLKKPKWYTQKRYPLKNRVLWRDWQDAAKLIGVRPNHETLYALLDIDTSSPYHPNQDASAIARMQAALETIGITRTLLVRSSWSEGVHIYIPLPLLVKTFDLAVSLQNCLEAQGFRLKLGELEVFPNVKSYGTIQKIEYRAHRLPLQPESGSCLLDKEFNPISAKLSDFLTQWDIATTGQDVATLQAALPIARSNRRKKVRKRLNKTQLWKADLETILSEGWTGVGQTNQLLKEFGCYGVVFLDLRGEDLAHYVHQQAITSPGYKKWCRHQHEIEMRSRVWAASVEKYYWPLGSYSDIRQTTKNDIIPFNTLRAQQAQANITAAFQQLKTTHQLPEQPTARAQAIRKAQADAAMTSSSMETLYRPENKKLWHPDYYEEIQENQPVITVTEGTSAPVTPQKEPTEEMLKPNNSGKLRTKEKIMKCPSPKAAISVSAKTKFYSGKGGLGGGQSFPQTRPIVRSTELLKPEPLDIETETSIHALQQKVRSLNWSGPRLSEFITRVLSGKRPSEFNNHDRITLLYCLQAATNGS